MQLTHAIDAHIPWQLQLGLADRQRAMWHVAMSIATGGHSWPLAWEGYAQSSIDASGKALAWANDQAAEISDEFKVRVVEVLQVGV